MGWEKGSTAIFQKVFLRAFISMLLWKKTTQCSVTVNIAQVIIKLRINSGIGRSHFAKSCVVKVQTVWSLFCRGPFYNCLPRSFNNRPPFNRPFSLGRFVFQLQSACYSLEKLFFHQSKKYLFICTRLFENLKGRIFERKANRSGEKKSINYYCRTI